MTTPTTQSLLEKFDELGDTYLRDEVEQALQLKEEITPLLLQVLRDVAENPLVYTLEMRNAHVYAALLLSEFREPAAHELFISAFLIPEEQLVDIWGDLTTETLPTFLYRTCSDSLESIKALIINREADQFVRCAAMESLSYVVAFDPSKREEVLNFLQGLFTGEEAAKESYFWGNLTATLCDLHPGESMECIQGAFEKKLISDVFITLSQVEEAGKRSLEQAQEDLKTWVTARMPTDVHAYISWFAEFNQEDRVEPQPKVKPKKNSGKKKGKKKGKK
ncbi:DUF1186 domain-containing protein [Desulfobulbus rhabdoformis]|jgi:hypothetical protein|uniref:DUF1186 domain-containing protein n=1 Tax=Desulfobulbus rhabdoformis TaxID=34032 RepID=UPI001964D00A|nr:DUF1186 domain-containing protein [Desulfobulbus rhabdoformis]MBM9616847.1 DUF1186 domain-containing protein [Desulfobulbus rhabdoformis]